MSVLDTDTFTGADGTALPTYNAKWATVGGGAVNMTIKTNAAQGATTAGNVDTGISWPNDQYSQAVVVNPSTGGSDWMGVIVRGSTSALTYYAGGAGNVDNFDQNYRIHRELAGVKTTIGTAATQTMAAADVVRLDVQGSNLTLKLGGTAIIGPTSDTQITSGSAGIWGDDAASADGPLWDTWEGGDFGAPESGYYSPAHIANRFEGPMALRQHFHQPIFQYSTSGPNAFTQALTATLSFIGALNITVNKSLTGTLSFIGALTKRTSKLLTGTLSFVGAFIVQTKPKLTGSLSFIGAISKAISTKLSGTLAFVGSLLKAVTKGLTATLSFIGTLTKFIPRALAGTLSFIGALAVSRVVLVALTATLSFSGAMTKQVSKGLAATLSFVGALTKMVSLGLTAALSFIGSIIKLVRTGLTATLSFVGNLVATFISGAGGAVAKLLALMGVGK